MKNKTIAITGASGFLGGALIERLLPNNKIKAMGHSEKRATDTQRKYPNCEWLIGDILDFNFLNRFFSGADIAIHCSAQKHIPVAEKQPSYSIATNVLGSQLVIDACIRNGVKEVIGISTDKACNPKTVYGMTKYLMERMFQERSGKTKFYTCRYGNVANSSGSVFEIWDKCGKEGGTFKITVPDMTRFYFTVDEAVDTVMETYKRKQKEPYIPKMKAMVMGDVLDVFMEHYDSRKMEIIGNRGNEKIHEELTDKISSDKVAKYTKQEIIEFLNKINLLK